MKKIITLVLVAVLALSLASVAFAADLSLSYDEASGRATVSNVGEGVLFLEKDNYSGVNYVTFPAAAGETGTVTYTGAESGSYTYSVPAAVEPTEAPVEPTEAPVEPTEAPVEPTEAPVEPTEAPVEPTEAPVEPTKAPDGPVDPVNPVDPADSEDAPAETDANGKDSVPKTGEFDSTMIVIAALSIAVVGFAGVVVTKKYGKEN